VSDVISALKKVYAHDYGIDYDKVCMEVLQAYKRGGRSLVVSYLSAPENREDPCAKLFRELLHVRTHSPRMFSFCQTKLPQAAPDWIKDHGWRVKKWPDFMPYIPPRQPKE
jgi:hypothetical protein